MALGQNWVPPTMDSLNHVESGKKKWLTSLIPWIHSMSGCGTNSYCTCHIHSSCNLNIPKEFCPFSQFLGVKWRCPLCHVATPSHRLHRACHHSCAQRSQRVILLKLHQLIVEASKTSAYNQPKMIKK